MATVTLQDMTRAYRVQYNANHTVSTSVSDTITFPARARCDAGKIPYARVEVVAYATNIVYPKDDEPGHVTLNIDLGGAGGNVYLPNNGDVFRGFVDVTGGLPSFGDGSTKDVTLTFTNNGAVGIDSADISVDSVEVMIYKKQRNV